jgi:hypothetical protein
MFEVIDKIFSWIWATEESVIYTSPPGLAIAMRCA